MHYIGLLLSTYPSHYLLFDVISQFNLVTDVYFSNYMSRKLRRIFMLNGLAEASTESINMVIDLIGKISLIWEIIFNIQRILKYNKIEHILTNIWASIWYHSMSSLISVMWILWALWWCHSPISLLAHIKLTPVYPSVLCCMKKKFSSECSASGPQNSVTSISFLARYKIALSNPPSVLSQKCTFVGGGVGGK